MEEKRKSLRFKIPFCIDYKNLRPASKFCGVIKDISMQGAKVLVDTSSDLPTESRASLSIFLPEDTLEIPVKVVWSKERGQMKEVGIYFVDITQGRKKSIYNHIFKYLGVVEDIT